MTLDDHRIWEEVSNLVSDLKTQLKALEQEVDPTVRNAVDILKAETQVKLNEEIFYTKEDKFNG